MSSAAVLGGAVPHPDAPAAAGSTTLRVLTLTSLVPSVARPRHGIFVETRLVHLLRSRPEVDARVVAPVPWFPFKGEAFGQYGRFAATPRRTTRDSGLQVSHPRYLMLPKVGVAMQPDNMARAALRDIAALARTGWQPDLIDAHYFYPDGVAAAIVAQRLGVPFVVTARGTDVNVLGRLPGSGERIRWAAQRAAAVVAVSTRLKEALVGLGVEAAKVTVLRNGVDFELFRPEDRLAARQALGLAGPGRLAACVGNLVPEKGFALAIEALPALPQWQLLLVGEGPQRGELEALAQRLGVAGRVSLRPSMPQKELRRVYSAADVLLLTSLREGWPNVVLEAMACGTPVVAVDVGAVGEMITRPEVGRIVAARDREALAAAVHGLFEQPPAAGLVRAHAAQFDWASVSQGQWDLFSAHARGR